MHVLATGRGLSLAARLGLPVVVGGPVLDGAEVGGACSPATGGASARTAAARRG